MLGLAGASGVGKTRLLRAMADLDPHAGDVALDNTPQERFTPSEWRRRVALVPTESAWWLSAAGDHFTTWPPPHLAALALDEGVGSRPVERLSSGERQRLAVLRALDLHPEVLLLDEVAANLDQDNAWRLEALVTQLRREQGVAVVRVAHGDTGGKRIEVLST